MTGRHQIRALGRKGGGDKQADLAADGAVGEDLTMLGEGDLELPESWLDPDSEPALPAIRFGWLALFQLDWNEKRSFGSSQRNC